MKPQINPINMTIPRMTGTNPIKRKTLLSRANKAKSEERIKRGT
jgi:hypothetical protein